MPKENRLDSAFISQFLFSGQYAFINHIKYLCIYSILYIFFFFGGIGLAWGGKTWLPTAICGVCGVSFDAGGVNKTCHTPTTLGNHNVRIGLVYRGKPCYNYQKMAWESQTHPKTLVFVFFFCVCVLDVGCWICMTNDRGMIWPLYIYIYDYICMFMIRNDVALVCACLVISSVMSGKRVARGLPKKGWRTLVP